MPASNFKQYNSLCLAFTTMLLLEHNKTLDPPPFPSPFPLSPTLAQYVSFMHPSILPFTFDPFQLLSPQRIFLSILFTPLSQSLRLLISHSILHSFPIPSYLFVLPVSFPSCIPFFSMPFLSLPCNSFSSYLYPSSTPPHSHRLCLPPHPFPSYSLLATFPFFAIPTPSALHCSPLPSLIHH